MTTKQKKIESFNPSGAAVADATIFGLPFNAEESEIIIVPVPWEVTVSYGGGASKGPESILESSYQVDLLHQQYPKLWQLGIFYDDTICDWADKGKELKSKASAIIENIEDGIDIEKSGFKSDLQLINKECSKLMDEVQIRVRHWLDKGKKVVLLGGDHSTPLGYYRALAERHSEFGILHFDAHMDLRNAYEGFLFSHASIMNNAVKIPQVQKLVQVGIRDFCEEEINEVKNSGGKIEVYTNFDLKKAEFENISWQSKCDEIIASLPRKVAISFDIDCLEPWNCPNTGTPVPGGVQYEKTIYLISRLAESDREIIGVDLVEVAPGENDWDGNVGARLLYHLCGAFAKSQGLNVGREIKFN